METKRMEKIVKFFFKKSNHYVIISRSKSKEDDDDDDIELRVKSWRETFDTANNNPKKKLFHNNK